MTAPACRGNPPATPLLKAKGKLAPRNGDSDFWARTGQVRVGVFLVPTVRPVIHRRPRVFRQPCLGAKRSHQQTKRGSDPAQPSSEADRLGWNRFHAAQLAPRAKLRKRSQQHKATQHSTRRSSQHPVKCQAGEEAGKHANEKNRPMGSSVGQTGIVAETGEDIKMALTTMPTRLSRSRRDRTYRVTTWRPRRTQTEPPEMWTLLSPRQEQRKYGKQQQKGRTVTNERGVALSWILSVIPLNVLHTPIRT